MQAYKMKGKVVPSSRSWIVYLKVEDLLLRFKPALYICNNKLQLQLYKGYSISQHDQCRDSWHNVSKNTDKSAWLISRTLVSNELCLVRALHRVFASKKAKPNWLEECDYKPEKKREKTNILLAHIIKV